MNGKQKDMSNQNFWQKCPICDGDGKVHHKQPGWELETGICPTCKGYRIISTLTGLPPYQLLPMPLGTSTIPVPKDVPFTETGPNITEAPKGVSPILPQTGTAALDSFINPPPEKILPKPAIGDIEYLPLVKNVSLPTRGPAYTLEIEFTNGKVNEVDFGPYLMWGKLPPYLKKYRKPDEFRRFRIKNGNVVWGKAWDLIFPLEELYNNSIKVPE